MGHKKDTTAGSGTAYSAGAPRKSRLRSSRPQRGYNYYDPTVGVHVDAPTGHVQKRFNTMSSPANGGIAMTWNAFREGAGQQPGRPDGSPVAANRKRFTKPVPKAFG